MKPLPALALLLPSLALADPAPSAVKIAVVPFAPLTGEVPNNAGTRAAEVLLASLRQHDDLAPTEAGGGPADDPASHARQARDLLTSARKLLAQGKPAPAKDKLTAALAEFAAGAASLDDPDDLADAHAALSRALYQSGDDAAGLAELDAALALRPGRNFLEARGSPLFAGIAAKEKDRVLALAKASLRIDSVPAGAQAHIDGLDAGRTPVAVRDLPPGPHLWRVDLPSGGSVGGVAQLKPGEKGSALGAQVGTGPASALLARLAQNALDENAVAAMKAAAAGLDAQLLIFGGLHADGSDLVCDSFLYSAKANAFARLPRVKFDSDFVSAGQELFKVANDVAGRASAGTLGAAASLPVKISEEVAGEAPELSELHFPAPGSEAEPKKESGPRRVVGARHGPVRPGQ